MGYLRPATLAEALDALARTHMPVIAGGTDFYPARQARPLPPGALDISGIAELSGIGPDAGGWRIGAMTTWSDIARADLPPGFCALQAAAREVGSVQIQNSGTIAGNLCNASPAADGVPPLMAMNAVVELASANGRRRLALNEFLMGPRKTALLPGELVTAVLVPELPNSARSAFCKLGSRRYLVISFAMVAVLLVPGPDGAIKAASVSVGACSPVAVRLGALEAALLGRNLADVPAIEISAEMLRPLAPIDDVRANAGYRSAAARELIRQALRDVARSG